MKLTKTLPFYLVTISVAIFLVLPILVQDGMFMDGQQYACIAKNLSNGNGSFWFPYLSETWWRNGCPHFMEHPPLFYDLESLAFKIFGDGMYTERIFSFLMLVINALVIHKIWVLLSNEFKMQSGTSWYPILLWIIIPVCYWSFQNNMIEIVLSVFSLGAVYFLLNSILKPKYRFISLVLASVFIFSATLTKGFPGLFTISTIPLFYVTTHKLNFKNTLISTTIVCVTILLLYITLFFLNCDAKESLSFYFHNRFLDRISYSATTDNRFYIFIGLMEELLPSLVIVLLFVFLSMRQKIYLKNKKENNQLFLFFIFLGLCGSLPIMLTFVQKKFYFAASLPYFAFALAFLNIEFLSKLISEINTHSKAFKLFFISSVVVFMSSLVVSFFQVGKQSRDADMLYDVSVLNSFLKQGEVVSADTDVYNQWNFQFYILRKNQISIEPSILKRQYHITDKPFVNCEKYGYQKINLPTKKFILYKYCKHL